MSGSGGALDAVAWPRDRLGDAMFALARRAGLSPRPVEPAAPPEEIVGSTGLPLERWMESAARWLGLEAELVAGPLADLGAQIASAAPALVRVGERARFLAVLSADARDVALLAPDLSVKRLPIARVAGALREEDEAPFRDAVDRLIAIAGVPPGRAERARAAIVAEQLRARGGRRVWHLRLPPGADLARQLRRAGLHRRLATYAGTHLAGYGLWLLSWWLVGRGALQDRLDGGWLSAWALLLFTLIPVRLISAWAGGALAIDAGALVKRRLLAGALALEPDEIRHAGAGQLLGRVIESDELQTLALEGGLSSLAAAIDLIAATAVIAAGAGGVGQAALLAIWTLFTAILAWRYLRRRARWTDDRLAMTHELVERMVGHRTRLAQERPDRWHDGEDHALLRYLDRGRDLDRAAIALTGFVPRGWMVAGVLGLAPAFVAGGSAAPAIAVAIGGVLLGHQALRTLVAGLSQLAGAAVAWRQIQPLYRAAARADLAPPVADAPKTTDEQPGEPALLEAYGVVYRHGDRAEPVLRGCDLQIHAGDRLLLEEIGRAHV